MRNRITRDELRAEIERIEWHSELKRKGIIMPDDASIEEMRAKLEAAIAAKDAERVTDEQRQLVLEYEGKVSVHKIAEIVGLRFHQVRYIIRKASGDPHVGG